MDGVGEYQKLEEELEYKIDFQKRTLIELIEDEKYIQEASEIGALYKRNGFFGEIIDTAEIHKLEPGVCLDTVISALLAEQWTIDPMKTLFGYYLKAREYGMDWYPFAPVMDFIREGTKILGVKTPKGDIFGDQIVTAVGAMDFCASAFHSLWPALRVIELGGRHPWDESVGVTKACCPDPEKPVTFRIEAYED